jgi:hypothetical protein
MTTPTNTQQLVGEVARQKETALLHLKGNHRFLAVSMLAGVVVGLGAWFSQRPPDRDSLHLQFALALAAAVFCFACLLGRLLFPKPSATCPQCGCDWNLESENNTQLWLAWRCCPGCGLDMCGDVNEDEVPGEKR